MFFVVVLTLECIISNEFDHVLHIGVELPYHRSELRATCITADPYNNNIVIIAVFLFLCAPGTTV